MDPIVARKMHRTLEAYHGMIYFSREAGQEYEALGLTNAEGGYFASRAAPMGAVTPEVVVATFFNFWPAFVTRAMDGVWDVAPPAAWTAARLRAVDATLRRRLGDELDGPDVRRALDLARVAADACWSGGRPLAAGLLGLDRPTEPHLALWHAIAVLREFRGDGHVAVLVESGVSPCEALHLHAGTGEVPAALLQATRAWPDEIWGETGESLRARGLVDDDGGLTDAGTAFRDDLEDRTDRAALAAWEPLGTDGCHELRRLVRPLSRALFAR